MVSHTGKAIDRYLESVCSLYTMLTNTKEESFLVGYLVALGGELDTIKRMQDDFGMVETELNNWRSIIVLIEADAKEVWTTIFKENLKRMQRMCEEHIAQTKAKLRELLQKRGAPLPEWLQSDRIPTPADEINL